MAFAAYLNEIGAPVDGYFQRQGLPALCRDSNAFVPLGRAWALFDDAARREGKDLAWHVGRYVGDMNLNAGLVQKLRNSPTLYKALQRLCLMINSEASHLKLGIIERENHILFYTTGYFDLRNEPGFFESQSYQIEVYTALIRQFTGSNWKPEQLGICAAYLPKVVKQHFPDCRIKLRQPFSYIAIPRSDLHLPALTGQAARPLVSAPIMTDDLSFAEALALLIRPYLPEGYPSVRFAAALADTSVRTLSRRLSACGTSYQAVVDELRFKLARDLLRDPNTSIRDAAAATGFRDQGNFSRMFRRVGGVSPREFRK